MNASVRACINSSIYLLIDAKTLLPHDLIVKASKSPSLRCVDLCALLCTDDDLSIFKLVYPFSSSFSSSF